MPRAFTHLEPGTDEAVWAEDARYRGASELDADVAALLVVAAHPDDETLGAGGLMRRVHEAGGRVVVIVATDGEGSHPDSPTHTPSRLAAVRRDEVTAALREIAPGARVRFLALADGGLREEAAALGPAVAEAIDDLRREDGIDPGRVLAVSPWSGDGHRDHRIAAETLAAVCAARGIRHLGYPIWLWHWGTPDDVPWPSVVALTLDDREQELKQHALALHASQVRPLSPAAGDEAIVHDEMRAHFEREREVFIAEPVPEASSLPASFFDAFYARHDDPWGFETRWYEERKRSILLAALPRKHLGQVLEIGCATGLTTAGLQQRADTVVAIDAADAALAVARARVPAGSVQFIRGVVPADWPGGGYDTIIVSEVAYYLSEPDLAVLLQRLGESLAGDGCLVACHWRHPVAEYPQSGDAVHDALRAHAGWQATVRHEERDFLLEVFERRPARSVAEREGLL